MKTYGLTHKDLEDAKFKIKKQKAYLESFEFFKKDTGEIKTLLDYSYSANLSKRYYARILNRVHTFVSLGISNELTPVFLTVTLDGFFRDMMRGDYTRFFTPDIFYKYQKHIPNNFRNGHYLDYIIEGSYSDIDTKKTFGKPLTPKDLYKILSHQMHRFTRSKTLQDIRQKYDQDYMMLRVTEPHKDGVPHFHILLYIPGVFMEDVYKEFHKFFPAPRNAKKVNIKDNGRIAQPIVTNSQFFETQGFQTEIRSAPAYILKYILKSFRNLIEERELDYLQAWYIHNKIPRIIMTHSLLSQEAFHHFSLIENDWFYLTNIKKNFLSYSDSLFQTFVLQNERRRYLYKNGLYQYYVDGKLLKEFGEDKTKKIRFSVEYPYFQTPKNLTCKIHRDSYRFFRFVPKPRYKYHIKSSPFIPVVVDESIHMHYHIHKGILDFKYRFFPISKIKTSLLYTWYKNFDFDKYHPAKYGLIKRELILRGYLKESLDFKLDDFNTNFD